MKIASAWQRQNLQDINNNAINELKTKGVTFHDIDREALKAKALPAVEALRKNVPEEWLDAYKEAVK